MGCGLPGSSVHGDSPGRNTGVGCHTLFQGVLPARESNPGQEDPLEKEMTTHSKILAWEIPWIEEPGGLQSTGSQELDTT